MTRDRARGTRARAARRRSWRGWRAALKREAARLLIALTLAALAGLVTYLGLLAAAHRLTR